MSEESDLNVAHWIAATVLGFWHIPNPDVIAGDIIAALHEEEFL